MDWSKKYKNKCSLRKQYKYIYSVPLTKRINYIFNLITEDSSIKRILEVGAGEHSLKSFFLKKNPSITYKTVDIDKSTHQDYYNINDINEQFDLIIGLEVIEHIEFDCIEDFCNKLFSLTQKNGTLLLSTPNIYHPTRYYNDFTHKTPLSYDELGSLLISIGYKKITLYRVYSDSTIRRIARQYLFSWLYRLLEIDYAKGIVVVANKSTPLN